MLTRVPTNLPAEVEGTLFRVLLSKSIGILAPATSNRFITALSVSSYGFAVLPLSWSPELTSFTRASGYLVKSWT